MSKRPETGLMKFGDDWTGLFIRGDNAMGYMLALSAVLDGRDHRGIYARQLRRLIDMFDISNEMNHGPDTVIQQAVLVPAPPPIEETPR